MHKKISEMPKEWPLPRKGKKYIAVASHDNNKSIPVVFALRDLLKIAKSRREAKKICLEGNVKINNKIRKDIAFPIQLRDLLQLEKIGKNYRLVLKNKKFIFEEIKPSETGTKVVKVIGKVVLRKDKFQANLQDGRNFIMENKFSCGDSAIVDFTKDKIVKFIPLKKDSLVEIIKGKHIGEKGKIIRDKKEGSKIMLEIKLEDERIVCLDKKVLLAIE